ncbi:MAG: methionine synthase [Prevotella sp.]|nr:methionine synthase [Prevotella sp.]
MTCKQLSFNDLAITPADIYEQMGYGDAVPDEQTQRETQALMDEVHRWLRPQFCFFVSRNLPAFHMGSIIEQQLRGSEAYALFICTAGVEYEAWQQRLKELEDMVRVYIADAMGSVIAEKCADRMEEHLQQSIDKLGWHHTNRFSPGYCGWHVSEQQLLFPLFAGQTCGVCLTDSSLMVPIKSVSGLIGVGKEVRRLDYTCGLCEMHQCYKRRKK